jgi:hypothetical protein
MTTSTTTATSKEQRERERDDVRRILLFYRAANRLRELTTKYRLNVKVEFQPALVQPADRRQRFMAGMKIVEGVDQLVIENLATRIRPFMLVQDDCFFLRIVKALPRYVRIENGPMTFDELKTKWQATLKDTSVPIPSTTWPNFLPGITAESSKGRLKLMVNHKLLSGEEVINLLLYGELSHVRREQERQLIRIRELGMAPGFEVAVIAVAAALGQLIDILRLYAEVYINQLSPEIIKDIEENVP